MSTVQRKRFQLAKRSGCTLSTFQSESETYWKSKRTPRSSKRGLSHPIHRKDDRVALDPSRGCLGRPKSRPSEFAGAQEERAGQGPTTTDMPFGAFVRTHLLETASFTPCGWPEGEDESSRP